MTHYARGIYTSAMSTPSEVIGGNVRAEMARKKIPQAAVGKRLGLSQTAVSKRLSGHIKFNVDELHEVAHLLGVPVSTLLLVTAESTPPAVSA